MSEPFEDRQHNIIFRLKHAATLQGCVATLDRNTATLEKHAVTLERDVVSLEQNVTPLERHATSLERNPATLQRNVATLEKRAGTLQGYAVTLERNDDFALPNVNSAFKNAVPESRKPAILAKNRRFSHETALFRPPDPKSTPNRPRPDTAKRGFVLPHS